MQSGEPRVIPSAPTYKLRHQQFFFHDARVLPSYLQVGPSFFIELVVAVDDFWSHRLDRDHLVVIHDLPHWPSRAGAV